MISLTIKAQDREQAVEYATKRGLPATPLNPFDSLHNQQTLTLADHYEQQVRDWYHEESGWTESEGYPLGTLLHFRLGNR